MRCYKAVSARYVLDGPGVRIPVGGEIVRTRPHWYWGLSGFVCTEYRVGVAVVKWPGRDVDHPPRIGAEIKERVELYLYSPSGLSWSLLGRTLLYKTVYFE